MVVGNRIYKMRTARHLSYQTLADKAEVGKWTVIRLEKGNLGIAVKNFIRICKALGVDASDILDGL